MATPPIGAFTVGPNPTQIATQIVQIWVPLIIQIPHLFGPDLGLIDLAGVHGSSQNLNHKFCNHGDLQYILIWYGIWGVIWVMWFVHLDVWTSKCPNPQITIWAKFGALMCDLGCNLGHNLSHDLGVIWATVNAPNIPARSKTCWEGTSHWNHTKIHRTS